MITYLEKIFKEIFFNFLFHYFEFYSMIVPALDMGAVLQWKIKI